MTTSNGKETKGLEAFLNELNELSDEVDAERLAEMKNGDQRLEEVAREILHLERDMTVPGSPNPDNLRIERLMRFIEEQEF